MVPCSLEETYFLGKPHVLENHAVGCLEMFINLHHTTKHWIPKDGTLHGWSL